MPRHPFVILAGLVSLAVLAAPPRDARALSQPDGTIIPVGAGLQDLFTARGEAISALDDARTIPETFVPSCALTFEVLQRNAGYMNSFGWYNVTGAPPDPADLHEVLACTDGVGTSHTVDIRNDPAYLGGEVAFFEGVAGCASPGNYDYAFYSQKDYNPDSAQANPYIHLLIYDSTVVPRAFYFGWEDLISGGDNDFDDLTTFVTGITCSGGGGPCDTGAPGVCAAGTLQCRAGALQCVPSSAASDEVCDGLDNDCDGEIDDAAPCPGNEVCDRGVCVPPCTDVEFPCAGDLVCVDGLCVDPDCVDVVCQAGSRCVEGDCVEPCTGVTCPWGQVCRLGNCVDPCATLECDAAQICVEGVCTDRCECTGCAPGETCQTDGYCVEDLCLGVTCGPGEHCDAGTCVDGCLGATCPDGQVCEAGVCVPAPPGPDAGVPDAGPVDAAPPVLDAAPADAADATGADAGDHFTMGGSGCDCRTGGAPGGGAMLLGLLVFVLLRRRRR